MADQQHPDQPPYPQHPQQWHPAHADPHAIAEGIRLAEKAKKAEEKAEKQKQVRDNAIGCLVLLVIAGLGLAWMGGAFQSPEERKQRQIEREKEEQERTEQRRLRQEELKKPGHVPPAGDPRFSGAWNAAQEFVTRQLKAPATAEFPSRVWSGEEIYIYHEGDGKYVVRSWVDSENSFGAQLRTHFEVVIQKGDDSYTLVNFTER